MRTFACILLLLISLPADAQQKMPVILDADTGNEVDDLYAVVRALLEPSWEITSLNATQWQTSHWAVPNAMENSHRINQVLLGHLAMSVPTKRGGPARMYDWGDKAQHSAAAYEIIRQAHRMPEGEKLTVVALGALTNVASAIYIDPSVEPRIRLFWLGTEYDFDRELMTIVDFNCMMDMQALFIMLHSDVEMHVMPHSVALAMDFSFDETEQALRGLHPLGDYLVDRWANHLDGLRKSRWIWDLALIEAMIHPEWTEEIQITTAKEFGAKRIHIYRTLNGVAVKQDFFDTLQAAFVAR